MNSRARGRSFVGCCALLTLASAIAAACGSSDKNAARDSDSGTNSGGDATTNGGSANVDAGGSSTGPSGDAGGGAGSGSEPSDGGSAGSNGGAPSSDAGGGGGGVPGSEVFVPEPVTVDSFGCFFATGDGGDYLVSGEPATIVTSSPHSAACGTSWISDNALAYSPKDPPTTLSFARAFIIDESLANSSVRISFKADDAIEFVLNGEVIADCMPTAGNPGQCQQACTNVFLNEALLRVGGEVNTLEFRLINLNSTPAGGENWGWTAVSYEVCITPPS